MAWVICESAEVASFRQAHTAVRSFRLTAYAAAYLETARREQAHLATFYRALSEAAKQAGIPLFL